MQQQRFIWHTQYTLVVDIPHLHIFFILRSRGREHVLSTDGWEQEKASWSNCNNCLKLMLQWSTQALWTNLVSRGKTGLLRKAWSLMVEDESIETAAEKQEEIIGNANTISHNTSHNSHFLESYISFGSLYQRREITVGLFCNKM